MSFVFKKGLFCACVLLNVSFSVHAQKLTVQKGSIRFSSKAQLELIEAVSDKVQGIVDISTSQFAFQVAIKAFRGFNSELQREHFNEKYMESELYPKASFTGKIIEPIDFSQDGIYDVRAKGDLEIHGQKQTRIIRSKIIVKGNSVNVESSFKVPLADHNITVPTIVNQKIATEIEVNINVSLASQAD